MISLVIDTLPKPIRDSLRRHAGDDGEIRVRAGHVDVRELRGLLRRPARKTVTLDQMDDAIRRVHGGRT